MIDVCWRKIRSRLRPPSLACWPVICCLAISGCASKVPQAANGPSSYPPWVCGLSHNKNRWQCQREGEEPAPSVAPSTEGPKSAPAKTPHPAPATDSATAVAKPEPAPPPTESAPDGDNAAPRAASDAPPESADKASAPARQGPLAASSQRSASNRPADEGGKLMALHPDYFAIQAGAFPNAEALRSHALQYGIEPAYRVRLASQNRLFHVLILQVHESRRAAEAALANLPQPLSGMDLWIRSVGSLQNAVRAGDALANEQPTD